MTGGGLWRELVLATVAGLGMANAAAAAGKLALVGGTIHPVSAPPIADATLVVDGVSIIAVGQDVAIPPDARVQNISGLHVYPAPLDANTVLSFNAHMVESKAFFFCSWIFIDSSHTPHGPLV